jgi:dipeptidyl aminopeptidase/acylaminoacyl peptidase
LLSASRFYADLRESWGYEPSFDGSLIAWWGVRGTRRVVFVGETGRGMPRVIARFYGSIIHFSWRGYANRLLLTEGDRLFEVDPRYPSRRVDITPQGFQSWQIVSEPTSAGGPQAVISHDRSPFFTDLYQTRDDGTGKTLLEDNSGRTESWLLDGAQRPCLRVEHGEDGARRFLARTADEEGSETWNEIAALGVDETMIVWSVDPDGSRYEALSNHGRDKIALISIEPSTGNKAVIASSEDVDILDAVRFNPARQTDLVIMRDCYPTVVPVSERGAVFSRLLANMGEHADFEVTGASSDGRFVTAAVSIKAQQPRPVLFDLVKGKMVRLGREPRALPETTVAPVIVTTRDGEELHALLTRAKGSNEPMPAVVVAHGGPARHDHYGFHRDHAFLASRGYAVLSVNYRGSTGFGKRFQALGFRQFGRAMQDDLADAAIWLIDEKIAEAGRIVIQGESFGGTIAALAMCRDPDLFAAAIIDCAVLDLPFQMRNNPLEWTMVTDKVEQYFGAASGTDAEALLEYSPLDQVDRAHGSFLLTASVSDPIVSVEQTRQYESALRSAGRNVVTRYFEGEGHGYTKWQTRLARARAIELFLAETIGGKSKKIDWRTRLATYWN